MELKNERIVFMGTPEFAVATLDALVSAGFQVCAVVTAPDRPAGRGRQLRASAVKQRALELGIEQAHDIWLVFRADAKRVARVRKTLDWITRCYDPRKYPWFRDEFIRPDRFGELYKGAPPVRTAIFTPNLR